MRFREIISEAKPAEKLRLVSQGVEQGRDYLGRKYRSYVFRMLVNGVDRGQIYLKRFADNPDDAEVNVWGDGANKFGPRLMYQLRALIKKRFPDLKALHGRRISGAQGQSVYHVQRIRLDRDDRQ